MLAPPLVAATVIPATGFPAALRTVTGTVPMFALGDSPTGGETDVVATAAGAGVLIAGQVTVVVTPRTQLAVEPPAV